MDPQHVQSEPLRVINEDHTATDVSSGTRSHRGMEIISYVFDNELTHKDNMSNDSVLRRGNV